MPSSTRPSGGARAVAAKRRARDANRPEGYNDQAVAAMVAIPIGDGSSAAAYDEAIQTLLACMREARADPGVPPEYRREQAARIGSYVVKAVEPKTLIDALAADLREAKQDIVELESKLRAARQPARDSGRPSAPAEH